jgi:hypothetical protein
MVHFAELLEGHIVEEISRCGSPISYNSIFNSHEMRRLIENSSISRRISCQKALNTHRKPQMIINAIQTLKL